MELLSSYMLTLLAFALSANAMPLLRLRANSEGQTEALPTEEEEERGPDGHLTEPWVVAVAVALVVVIIGVVATIVFVKWRQRRRARAAQSYSRTADELVAGSGVREQPYERWNGPYVGSRTSYNRSPTPPTLAHVSEKTKWSPPQR